MSDEIEIRAAKLSNVKFKQRLIELVVMPYEEPTAVEYRGRMITEVCSRGAYDGVERRTSQIRVNRDHQVERTVGKAVALHPSRDEGLIAELHISKTDLGEETLVLADDGCLDASAGFSLLAENGRIKPGAEVWEARDRRRLNHLFLGHIGLTPDPAYEGATVLAVRHASDVEARPARPVLEELRRQELEALYADIDRRYGSVTLGR